MTDQINKASEWAADVEKRLIAVTKDEDADVRNVAAEAACCLIAMRQALEAARTVPDTHVLLPKIPSEEQWSGLARDIVMAWDMDCKTPRKLFQHLDRCGRGIPDWLRDESEMRNLDHIPSKGTRAVIIYRAMIEAASQGSGE